ALSMRGRACDGVVSQDLLGLGEQPAFTTLVGTRRWGRQHGLPSFLPERPAHLRGRGKSVPGGLRIASGRALVRGDKIIAGAFLHRGDLYLPQEVSSFPGEHRTNEVS